MLFACYFHPYDILIFFTNMTADLLEGFYTHSTLVSLIETKCDLVFLNLLFIHIYVVMKRANLESMNPYSTCTVAVKMSEIFKYTFFPFFPQKTNELTNRLFLVVVDL